MAGGTGSGRGGVEVVEDTIQKYVLEERLEQGLGVAFEGIRIEAQTDDYGRVIIYNMDGGDLTDRQKKLLAHDYILYHHLEEGTENA